MKYTTVDFAGIQIDSFLVDGQAYVTLTSFANGLGISRQNVKDWAKNHNQVEGIAVKVGKRQVPATAYPISVIGDFLDYRISLGDKQVQALYSATFRADLERTIKEANGIQVTAAQHEETRHRIRIELVNKYIPEYINGERNLNELTQEEKDLVFKQVTTYRQERNRIENESHFLNKFKELVGDRYVDRIPRQELKAIEQQAKAYRKEIEAKIKLGIHLDANDFLLG